MIDREGVVIRPPRPGSPAPWSGTPQALIPSPTLQDLRRDDYDYSFSVRRAAQDTIATGYAQNTPPDPTGPAVAAAADGTAGLGGSLTQFTAIREVLELDLALIPAVDPLLPTAATAAANPGAAQAPAVFARLVTRIAADWASWATPPAGPADPDPSARPDVLFELRRGASLTGGTTVALLPTGPAAELLADEPRVRLAGRLAADGHAQAGVAPVSFARAATALVAAPGPGTETLPGVDEFTLAVPDRDLINTQNIWGRVSLTRNANLLAGVRTASAFIYTVPDARMPAPATPLVSVTEPLDLTAVPFAPPGAPPSAGPDPTGRRQLADWLINFFDSLISRYAVLGDVTLPKIAARFGLGLAELIPAVADIPGLLLTGTPLALPGGTTRRAARTRCAGSPPPARCRSRTWCTPRPRPASRSPPRRCCGRWSHQDREPGDLRPDAGFCADLAHGLTSWASARGVPDDVGM